ncbi:Repeat domain-containing protein [Cnuella takakiae]|uniref:Repeat domain-containing protein n=2 Tax=Cnuella takakiae TaxID=1302690 RepID=A0A1M5AY91_9BACT|nr:VCBS repeat-containing protein [Cnuella takakiae]SHF35179.1 Repeat domain-containing protein [Cnuella takakiae]
MKKSPILWLLLLSLLACKQKATPVLFTQLDSAQTGIGFRNDLAYDAQFNIYTYRNFYNGGGVAIGDVNSDSLPDVFFTANMGPNKLYLNKGNFRFEEVTQKAGIGKKGKWSTGVSMADVNGDGKLDIYVCNSGDIKGDFRQNELYINKGDGSFEEKAAAYGLDERGLSTHAAFFDYDKDGDLDMFLLNNSFKAIGSFNLKENERTKRDSLGGHKFFRNDGNHFSDISEQAGIYGSVIGFGLGVTVGDVNNDGWQDIYVSNDFFERDYLYINKKDGTFSEELEQQMISTSNASMGADMADINNDAHPDIFVTEMLPQSEARVKTNTTFQSWDKFQLDLQYGYYYQYTRNMLQLNLGNGHFTDIGRFAGVHATDWSWGALITDMDLDGNKDIFVANGIYQDLTNQDYIQYISNESFFKQVSSGAADYRKMIDLIPSQPVSNYAFSNLGGLRFQNKAKEWGLADPSFSNGSAYGDLDGDGDLDLVVNNVNSPCFVYRNNAREQLTQNNYLALSLQGTAPNTYALGAQVTLYFGDKLAYQELMPMRGFQSTVDTKLVFGLGTTNKIDSIVVLWPDGKRTVQQGIAVNQHLRLSQIDAVFNTFSTLTSSATYFQPSTLQLPFTHQENPFVDFDRDKLLFHMQSTEGPRMATGDVNGDGRTDLYLCGAKGQPGSLLVQDGSGKFQPTNGDLLLQDRESEDVDALFFDADKDGDQDLYVCSGGPEASAQDLALMDRLYLNDGKGVFSRSPQALPSLTLEPSSCVRAGDWDSDGDLDLFVGIRMQAATPGVGGRGYLLQNDGRGGFTDITRRAAPELLTAGMIRDMQWWDYDKDGRKDMVLAGEWMGITVLHNEGGALRLADPKGLGLEHTRGWWNRLKVADLNGDGYEDLVALNHGENSRFRASAEKPVEWWVGDFDGNGSTEHMLTCYNGEESYPMALRHDVVGVLPVLKKQYLKYEQYREQTIRDMFTPDQLQRARHYVAEELRSVVVLNRGGKSFGVQPLPTEAQLSVLYGVEVVDVDSDGKKDLVLGGNFYESKPEVGIYDGSYGCVLKGDGRGGFSTLPVSRSGLVVQGAVRDIALVNAGGKSLLFFARNNASVAVHGLRSRAAP